MKHRLLLVPIVALLACGKTSDLTKLEEEATDVAGAEKLRFEELDRRANALVVRGKQMKEMGNPPPQIDDAGNILGDGTHYLQEIRAEIARVPTLIERAKGSAAPGAALSAVIDDERHAYEQDETIAIADIETVENWMSRASTPAPRVEHPIAPDSQP